MVSRVTRSVFTPAYVRMREALVAARVERNLTQVELARLLGRPQSFVSKYERGERRIDVVELLEIADALELDACGLLAEARGVSSRANATP